MKAAPDPNVITIPTTAQSVDRLYEHVKTMAIEAMAKEGYFKWSPTVQQQSHKNIATRLMGEFAAAGYTSQMYGATGFQVWLP